MATAALEIADVSLDQLAEVEAVMARAFEPRFGEAWTPAQCLAALTLPGYAVRVATSKGRVAGFSIIRHVAGESELLLLAVDPVHRSCGIGSVLIRDWLDWAAARGCAHYFLEMRVDNPARRLYERFGFDECGLRTAYYRGSDGVLRDAVTMDLQSTHP
jgi:[ribosomal protein S18]-alanine N-acetyltransferase